MRSAEVIRLLEEHDIFADRGRIWRVSEELGLFVRRPGSDDERHWTADQAQLVLMAIQLRVRRGLAPRKVQRLAVTCGGFPDPVVDELRTLYQRVQTDGGTLGSALRAA